MNTDSKPKGLPFLNNKGYLGICKTQINLKAVCADKGACGFLGSTLNFKKVLDFIAEIGIMPKS